MQMNRTPAELVRLGEQRTAILRADDLPQIISAKQAASLLGCSPEKVASMCRSHELDSYTENGSHKIHKQSALDYAIEHFGERTGLFDGCILGENREISANESSLAFTNRSVWRVLE